MDDDLGAARFGGGAQRGAAECLGETAAPVFWYDAEGLDLGAARRGVKPQRAARGDVAVIRLSSWNRSSRSSYPRARSASVRVVSPSMTSSLGALPARVDSNQATTSRATSGFAGSTCAISASG
ncbi:MAG TPA: hypothetical protein VHC63_11865 [Acidimicrobiales bacterium]|nr:hypothetical protein [Acidimicrobiales bacterium]